MTNIIYEWDSRKASANFRKHLVSFLEAATVFQDPLAMTYLDPDHSVSEDRELTFGRSKKGRLLVISHCQRAGRTRIISARKATLRERKRYEEDLGSH